MRIGLDIDGVLYPWHYSIYRYFTEHRGYDGDIGTFWLRDSHIVTDYDVSIATCYLDQIPTTDVLTYLPKIAELGDVYYITSRHEDLKWATRKFFSMYDLPFKENIIFSKDKASYVRLLGIDYFLDDFPPNVESLKGLTKAYLFKAIHNREQRAGFEVVDSLQEFYEILRSKNA